LSEENSVMSDEDIEQELHGTVYQFGKELQSIMSCRKNLRIRKGRRLVKREDRNSSSRPTVL
jgi:hypothetical protein